jgi:isoquinoline 1-oxidoreductase alpha subunit
MISLTVNGKPASVDAPGDMPLLWVLYDVLNLTGTKFGCGIGACGAGIYKRTCRILLHHPDLRRIWPERDDHRRPLGTRPASAPTRLDCRASAASEYCQSGQIMKAAETAREQSQSLSRSDYCPYGRQYLPLRHISQIVRAIYLRCGQRLVDC